MQTTEGVRNDGVSKLCKVREITQESICGKRAKCRGRLSLDLLLISCVSSPKISSRFANIGEDWEEL